MVDFRRGIIAGVAAAVVFLIIAVILEVTGLGDLLFVGAAGLRIWFYSAEPLDVLSVILPRLVQGVVFGAVFAALYVYLPGRTALRKAIVVSLMIWAIGVIRGMYISLRWPWQVNGSFPETASYWETVSTCILGQALIHIASAVAFGALVGAIWTSLKAREAPEPGPGSAALLAGSAIGMWMWLGAAVGVIIGAMVTGWSWELMPDIPGWMWAGILYTSAAVLGLAGWILVLLGWRRTRRGESGFRRGVAGGILMAVTGVMLLPGVVSIIGAVLSRREPASEPASVTQ